MHFGTPPIGQKDAKKVSIQNFKTKTAQAEQYAKIL